MYDLIISRIRRQIGQYVEGISCKIVDKMSGSFIGGTALVTVIILNWCKYNHKFSLPLNLVFLGVCPLAIACLSSSDASMKVLQFDLELTLIVIWWILLRLS